MNVINALGLLCLWQCLNDNTNSSDNTGFRLYLLQNLILWIFWNTIVNTDNIATHDPLEYDFLELPELMVRIIAPE